MVLFPALLNLLSQMFMKSESRFSPSSKFHINKHGGMERWKEGGNAGPWPQGLGFSFVFPQINSPCRLREPRFCLLRTTLKPRKQNFPVQCGCDSWCGPKTTMRPHSKPSRVEDLSPLQIRDLFFCCSREHPSLTPCRGFTSV